jgi:serine/threonine protein kinase
MGWPTPQDYNLAIQNPRLNLADSELKSGTPELDRLGLPRPRSGSFATVYRLNCGSRHFAAKCFTQNVPDQARRYVAIGDHLRAQGLPYTVGFQYSPSGIRIAGRWYPLLKMEWLSGETLTDYIRANLLNPARLHGLIVQWLSLVESLQRASVAHGDLQHGNILVVDGALRLIDYDGMWVPTLAGLQSSELGEPNYQSPQRTVKEFGPDLDNFSSWVIGISLYALAVDPGLWKQFNGGDRCILFRRTDFENPVDSPLIKHLRSSRNADLREAVALFESLLYLPIRDIPSLDGSVLAAIPSSSFSPKLPVWLVDHVAQPSKPPLPPQPPIPSQTAMPDPSWILDLAGIGRGQSPPAFLNSVGLERFSLAVTTALILLVLIAQPSQVSPLAVSLVLAASCFVLLRIRFSREPATKLSEVTMRSARTTVLKLAALNDEIGQIQESIRRREGREDIVLFGLGERRQGLKNAEAAKTSEVEATCTSGLQTTNRSRLALLQEESAGLQTVRATWGPKVTSLRALLDGLTSNQKAELRRALDDMQQQFLVASLSTYQVAGASLVGIGDAYKARLVAAGFKTAADINAHVRTIPGIGVKRMRAILAWRDNLEAIVGNRMPTSLDATLSSQIRRRYADRSQDLQRQINEAERALAAEEAAIRYRHATLRPALDDEDRTTRRTAETAKNEIRAEYARLYAALAEAEQQCRREAAAIIEPARAKEATLRREVFQLHFERAKCLAQLRTFRSASFTSYLRRIATLR